MKIAILISALYKYYYDDDDDDDDDDDTSYQNLEFSLIRESE